LLVPTIAVVTDPENLNEFKILAEEAGYKIVDIVKVRRLLPNGLSDVKLEELKSKILSLGAREVIFDVELKPRQVYNVAKELKIVPKDRIEIILEIFKKHSPSKEADLQIKLAYLHYELARAKEKVRLAKMGEQPGFYGLGEYEVDVYYNEIKKRIDSIKRKLENIRSKREIHRISRRRKGYKTIAITGYTSSGKSSLFNALTGLRVKTGPEPFTTLSTKFCVLKIGPWYCYLIDTIGFIRNLPPFLITAFYSTLEEIAFADLLLLVIDASEPLSTISEKLNESLKIIYEIGYRNKPIILVMNKIDLLTEEYTNYVLSKIVSMVEDKGYPIVPISALHKINIDKLIDVIKENLGKKRNYLIVVPYLDGSKLNELFTFIKRFSEVQEIKYLNDKIVVSGCVALENVNSIKRYIQKMGGSMKIGRNMDIKAFS